MRLFRVLCARKLPIEYSNFPQRYVDRAMEQVEFKNPKGPQYQDKVIKRETFTYTIDRPWTKEFYEANRPGKLITKDVVEPLKYWTIYRGDRVEIMKGKDKGKQGIVNYIVKERNWVTVEGLNCEYKKREAFDDMPAVVIKIEQPLLVTSEVALVDPGDNKPTIAEWRFTDDGEEVRVSKRTGRIIPMPDKALETYDYKTKSHYVEQDKDTTKKIVEHVTFKPKLCTFEQEIMEEMGIKEERIPHKTYFY